MVACRVGNDPQAKIEGIDDYTAEIGVLLAGVHRCHNEKVATEHQKDLVSFVKRVLTANPRRTEELTTKLAEIAALNSLRSPRQHYIDAATATLAVREHLVGEKKTIRAPT